METEDRAAAANPPRRTRRPAPPLEPAEPGLPLAVQRQLGTRLRYLYDSMSLNEQGAPGRLAELIQRLENSRKE